MGGVVGAVSDWGAGCSSGCVVEGAWSVVVGCCSGALCCSCCCCLSDASFVEDSPDFLPPNSVVPPDPLPTEPPLTTSMTVIVAICVIYVVLGTAMEELSMILLTVPVFFPLVVGLGFDPVWFGILIVVVVQIGLISPPVGMNMFVVKSMLPRIATATIFRGVTPFVVAEVVLLAVLVAFPSISLVLPRLMKL